MAVEVNSNRKGVEISWDTGDAPVDPVDPPEIWGGGTEPFPTPPIELPPGSSDPPGTWGPDDPRPNPPIELPPDILDGVDDEELKEKLKEKILSFALGNLPPFEGGPVYPRPVDEDGTVLAVQVFAQGSEGDWHNTAAQKNDGLAFLSYPADFKGESYVEIRALDGTVIDSGTIQVG